MKIYAWYKYSDSIENKNTIKYTNMYLSKGMDIAFWTNYRYVAPIATPIEVTTHKIGRMDGLP
jgi:hypothetical protein